MLSGNRPGAKVATALKTYAALMPSAISVNMFGLRLTTEIQARSKNGHPAQKTTGVARMTPIQFSHAPCDIVSAPPPTMSIIVSAKTGAERSAEIQNRRVIETSSGFGRSSSVMTRGSSAIPQIGHAPGWSRMISGSMGHVYSTRAPGGAVGGADDDGWGWRNSSGFCLKRSRQLSAQK